jgi:pantoate--beta-alanine ligase
MKVITSIAKMQEFSRQVRLGGLSIGFVPTMGFLHDGHMDLVRAAREECDVVVVSIFVNPAQFNDATDFDKYPRDEHRDAEMLVAERTDVLFIPVAADVYCADASTKVTVSALTDSLCGPGRPGHFDGVTTVVASLFNMVGPDKAYFGEKDFQQLQIVRRMVRDLHSPVEVVPVATTREHDGLAMSSRNARLAEEHREVAPAIFAALRCACAAFAAGDRDAAALVATAREVLEGAHELRIEYLEIVDSESLRPVSQADENSVMAIAATLGDVRLIDNAFLANPPRKPRREAREARELPDVIEYGSH